MSDVQQLGYGGGGYGGFSCNLAYCIAILLIIHCCLGRSFC
jgi:hypothetical protein